MGAGFASPTAKAMGHQTCRFNTDVTLTNRHTWTFGLIFVGWPTSLEVGDANRRRIRVPHG